MVAPVINTDMNSYLERSSAIVTEEGGMTSHAAIFGLTMDIPVILNATGILEKVKTGETITVDASRGVVYRGSSRVL